MPCLGAFFFCLPCLPALANALLRGCGSAESGMAWGWILVFSVSTFSFWYCTLFACLVGEGLGALEKQREIERGQ